MASSKQGTVLVTGGTGKVGSCVARLLTSAAQAHLVASRSSSSSTPARPHSVTFDWLDRATWDQPFNITTTTTTTTATGSGTITAGDGNGDHHHLPQAVTAVFLLAPQVFESSPILNDFVDHARGKYGVKRFVLLGATVVEPGGPAMGGTAKYLAELGGKGEIEWCILRPSWFQGKQASLVIFLQRKEVKVLDLMSSMQFFHRKLVRAGQSPQGYQERREVLLGLRRRQNPVGVQVRYRGMCSPCLDGGTAGEWRSIHPRARAAVLRRCRSLFFF